jgi:hypothetical protein
MSQMCKRKYTIPRDGRSNPHETETPMACFPHATTGRVIFRKLSLFFHRLPLTGMRHGLPWYNLTPDRASWMLYPQRLIEEVTSNVVSYHLRSCRVCYCRVKDMASCWLAKNSTGGDSAQDRRPGWSLDHSGLDISPRR